MSSIEALITDPYNRKARLQPALFTFLPILVSAAVLVPELGTTWATAAGLLAYCGGAMWLTQFGRDRGKVLEPVLFQSWDGKPSVALLRHRDERLAEGLKKRYRTFLQQAVSELQLATLAEEEEAPGQADDGYESANAWLLSQTRDRQRFKLIFEENVNYGFRRNLWALKPVALGLDGLIVVAFACYVTFVWTGDIAGTLQLVGTPVWAAVLVAIVHALLFFTLIRQKWVRVPAVAYAEQLLAACDILTSLNSKS